MAIKEMFNKLVRLIFMAVAFVFITAAFIPALADEKPNQYMVLGKNQNQQTETISASVKEEYKINGFTVCYQTPSTETNTVIVYFGGDGEKASFESSNHIFVNGWVTPDDVGAAVYSVLYKKGAKNAKTHNDLYSGILADAKKKGHDLRATKFVIIGYSNGGGDAMYCYETFEKQGIECICIFVDACSIPVYKELEARDEMDDGVYVLVSKPKNASTVSYVTHAWRAEMHGWVYPDNFLDYNMDHKDMLKDTYEDWSVCIENFVL